MNKKVLNALIIILTIFLIIAFFHSYIILDDLTFTLSKIFLAKIFPFLFVMMVINNFLIKVNVPYFINKIFHNPYIYIILMSALSGSPINAVILSSLMDEQKVTSLESSYILAFTTFNNPLFLYNYFHLLFPQTRIIIKLFCLIYIPNIILFTFFKRKLTKQITFKYHKVNIIKCFNESIQSSMNSLLKIYGTILFFFLFTNILGLKNGLIESLIKGSIEITQGLNALSSLLVNSKIKELLTLVILHFAGFCIHMQISSVLAKYNINYKYFYLSRLFLIITSFLTLVI